MMTKKLLCLITAISFFMIAIGQTPTTEEVRTQILKTNDELFHKGNLEYADKAFSSDYGGVGPSGIKQMIIEIRRAFPDLKVSIEPVIVEGNMAGWRRHHTGTHKGTYLGFAPTGNKISWHTIILTRYEDGKIKEEWGASNLLQVLQKNKKSKNDQADVLGVYRYLLDDQEGIAIMSPTHFIWVLTDKNRKPLSAQPTIEEKAAAYEAQNTGAGTWEFTGKNRVKFTFTHHANANMLGESFEWEYEQEGDQQHYWIIQADGNRGPLQRARKIALWNAPGNCQEYNGSWEYYKQNEWFNDGLYLQSGNYGVWIILNERVKDVSTIEGKAKAFDALNSRVVMGDCSKESRQYWTVLHAVNSRNEKQTIGSTAEPAEDRLYRWEIVDVKGNPNGVTWQVQRIKE